MLALSAALAPPVAARTMPDADPDTESFLVARILDVPESRHDDPRAYVHIVDHVAPGATIDRRIEIRSYAEGSREIEVYPGAATVGAEGFTWPADPHAGNELTDWIEVEESDLTVAPGKPVTAELRIRVPANAAPGERYAMLWAEPDADSDDDRPFRPTPARVARAGVRVYLSVGPADEPASDFTLDGLGGERNPTTGPEIVARVGNTGGRALDLVGEVTLTDGPDARSAGPFPVRLATIGLDDTRTIRVPVDASLPAGRWKAELVLGSGDLQRRVTGTVQLGADPADTRSLLRPSVLVALGTVTTMLILALGAGYAYRRRRGV